MTPPTDNIRLMLIGLGEHAKHAYIPLLMELMNEHRICLSCVVDVFEEEHAISDYLQAQEIGTETHFVESEEGRGGQLSLKTQQALDEIVSRHRVRAAVISTEPLSHKAYALWALGRGLSVLLAKPITARRNVAHSFRQADALVEDYDELLKCYEKTKEGNPECIFSVMTQRRFHPAFRRARELVLEVTLRTGCPITSIVAELADGEWRMPNEILTQTYHPYKEGYGAFSHGGYHVIDTVLWLTTPTYGKDKLPDNVDVFANLSFPKDHFVQLSPKDLSLVFEEAKNSGELVPLSSNDRRSGFGEIDGFASFAFRKGDAIITHANVNMIHTSFSQRGWLSSIGRNLYKGNGRVRQESLFIHQGPFQTLRLLSYQAVKNFQSEDSSTSNAIGSPDHLELHVFRNQNVFSDWTRLQTFTLSDLTVAGDSKDARGHQWQAKRRAFIEFVGFLEGHVHRDQLVSDLDSHQLDVALLSAIYKSSTLREQGRNPIVNCPISLGQHFKLEDFSNRRSKDTRIDRSTSQFLT